MKKIICPTLFFLVIAFGAAAQETQEQKAFNYKWMVYKVEGTDLEYKVDFKTSQNYEIKPEDIDSINIVKDEEEGTVFLTIHKASFQAMPEDFKKHFQHTEK